MVKEHLLLKDDEPLDMAEPLRAQLPSLLNKNLRQLPAGQQTEPGCLVPAQEHVATGHEGQSFRKGSAAFQLPGLWEDAFSSMRV